MLIFSRQSFLDKVFFGFRTHVVVTTVCTTGSVYTLTCCIHIFCCTVCLRRSAHLHACAHTRMAQVHENGVCRMSFFVLYLAFSLLMFHPSLLFLYMHFDITCLSIFLPNFPVRKAQDMRHSALASRSLASWQSQMHTQKLSSAGCSIACVRCLRCFHGCGDGNAFNEGFFCGNSCCCGADIGNVGTR